MREARTVCDVCGNVKQKTNNWFVVEVLVAGQKEETFLNIHHWKNELQNSEAKDACGQACVSVLVQRWVATESLEGAKKENA